MPASGGEAPAGDSVVLEELIDDNYEPSQREVLEYAKWLGIDLETESELMWIAREGLKAPLPPDWKPCKGPTGDVYYFNFSSGDSVWDHPCDDYYRALYDDEKKKLAAEKARRPVEAGRPVVVAAAATAVVDRLVPAVATARGDRTGAVAAPTCQSLNSSDPASHE